MKKIHRGLIKLLFVSLAVIPVLLPSCVPPAKDGIDISTETISSKESWANSPLKSTATIFSEESATKTEAKPTTAPAKKIIINNKHNVPYANVSNAQKLDIYVPQGGGPYPLVILIHGGGFLRGDKNGSYERARIKLLTRNGFAAATLNYRLSGEAIYPAQIEDVKTAVRFLRANADEFNIDPNHFAAWGPSAGGTLAALLGTTCGVEELEGSELGYADQSSCVSAVVDWFGLVDLLSLDEQAADAGCKGGHNDPKSPESRLVGAPIQTVPDLVAKTNPMNYITPDDAAFFIQHGSRDCRVPPAQSRMLAAALIPVIGKENVYYEEIRGARHGGPKIHNDENHQKILDFLDRYLKK